MTDGQENEMKSVIWHQNNYLMCEVDVEKKSVLFKGFQSVSNGIKGFRTVKKAWIRTKIN